MIALPVSALAIFLPKRYLLKLAARETREEDTNALHNCNIMTVCRIVGHIFRLAMRRRAIVRAIQAATARRAGAGKGGAMQMHTIFVP